MCAILKNCIKAEKNYFKLSVFKNTLRRQLPLFSKFKMSGFNRITQIQPKPSNNQATHLRQLQSPRPGPSMSMLMTPQPVNPRQSPSSTTPRHAHPQEITERMHTPVHNRAQFQTPENNGRDAALPPPLRKRMPTEIPSRLNIQVNSEDHGIPIKKRSLGESFSQHQQSNYGLSEAFEDDYFPANQLGLYSGGYDHTEHSTNNDSVMDQSRPNSQSLLIESGVNHQTAGSQSLLKDSDEKQTEKILYERVKEETIEMGGFILPGSEKKPVLKSYNWIAGREDGQYRVVLGNNTLFKVKNAIDSKTGEKEGSRWRVIRFENRYKENYPYTEFPARYIDALINSLTKAKEQFDAEQEVEIH